MSETKVKKSCLLMANKSVLPRKSPLTSANELNPLFGPVRSKVLGEPDKKVAVTFCEADKTKFQSTTARPSSPIIPFVIFRTSTVILTLYVVAHACDNEGTTGLARAEKHPAHSEVH